MDVIIEIGKSGLTPGLISEIKRQLELKKRIKVRIRKSALTGCDRKEFAQKVADASGSKLLKAMGYVVWLEKQGYKSAPKQKASA